MECVNITEQNRLEKKLLENIQNNKKRINSCLKGASQRRTGYEEIMYCYFYGSQKVFQANRFTASGYELLKELDPKEKKSLNDRYTILIKHALSQSFTPKTNEDWMGSTLFVVDAYLQTKYFLEMASRYHDVKLNILGRPYGWAALAVLYRFRNLDLQSLIDAEKFNRKA